jgi:predicted transposase YbfD/YdcC
MAAGVDALQACVQENNVDAENVQALLDVLVFVPDPRAPRGLRYPLVEVLGIAVLGFLCGCDDLEALEDWAEKEKSWLSRFFALEHGTPGQDVFLRVFAAMEPSAFRVAFSTWVKGIAKTLGSTQIAVDGQTLRGSRHGLNNPIHVVSALACESGLVVGQLKTREKSNEITAIPELLDTLDLNGALVSIDAMGCQTSIAQKVTDKGGDYLLGLKGNQSSLRDETEAAFAASAAPASVNVDEATPPRVVKHTEICKGHGRIETRTALVMHDFNAWVPAAEKWRTIQTLIAIDSAREEITSSKNSMDRRFYISSRVMTPEQAIRSVRKHWLIENQLHWCLDMTFGQDANHTRVGNAAENMLIVRQAALNLIRQYRGDRYTVRRRRRLCDYDLAYREQMLGI